MKRALFVALMAVSFVAAFQSPAFAQSEIELEVPDLNQAMFFGMPGRTLLTGGLVVSALGLIFGLIIYKRLQNMPVHESMREISELIYETCKTYLLTQGRFLMLLWIFIGAAITFYFGFLVHLEAYKVII